MPLRLGTAVTFQGHDTTCMFLFNRRKIPGFEGTCTFRLRSGPPAGTALLGSSLDDSRRVTLRGKFVEMRLYFTWNFNELFGDCEFNFTPHENVSIMKRLKPFDLTGSVRVVLVVLFCTPVATACYTQYESVSEAEANRSPPTASQASEGNAPARTLENKRPKNRQSRPARP